MKDEFESIILSTMFRYITPFILVYGVYILFHGEFSPGGAFQAGGLFGIAVVLDHLVQERNTTLFIPVKPALILAGIGTFFFIFIGFLSMLNAGNFLEYDALPFPVSNAIKHSIGIVGIEIGIAICVAATIIVIFDVLYRGKE